MKNFKVSILVFKLILVLSLSSCSITKPFGSTENPIGSKIGYSKAFVLYGIYYMDENYGIKSAARNGGISKIATIDVKYTDYFGIITSYETIVTGE